MGEFAVLYMFPEHAFTMSMQRLQRLRAMNPKVTFFPIVGLRQFFYFPMIIDKYMLGSNAKSFPLSASVHAINSIALSMPGVFRLSLAINKFLALARNKALTEMRALMNRITFQFLYLDFTPMALWNLDHTIMSWFNTSGKRFDFDYLICYESDIFTTKPLDVIYDKYMKLYDACFVEFDIASQDWWVYNFPPGSRKATMRWLEKRMLPTTLYRSMFAGTAVSRRCLEGLKKLGIDFSGAPYCQNEMRLPTLLSALGFRCGKLDFPFVRYRPEWSMKEILLNEDAGIFHPVKRPVLSEIASG